MKLGLYFTQRIKNSITMLAMPFLLLFTPSLFTSDISDDFFKHYASDFSNENPSEFIPFPEDDASFDFNIDPSEMLDYACNCEIIDHKAECNPCAQQCTPIKNCLAQCHPSQNENSFIGGIHGGVYPIIWIGRSNLPKYTDLFKTAWLVGGHFGYTINRLYLEPYLEFNYAQARPKGFAFDITAYDQNCCPDQISLDLNQGKYSLYSAYLGARYHTQLECACLHFFLGAKLGLIHHNSITSSIGICKPCKQSDTCNDLFFSNTVASGGINIGLYFPITSCIRIVLTGECIASGGLKNNQCIVLNPCLNPVDQRLEIGSMKAEFSFPITLGFQVEF